MSSHLPRQEYLTAAERVTRALRTAITTGALPAGAPIRQEEIAAQYQVSRIPVREAFRQLEAEGLLVIYPSRGAFVATLDANDMAFKLGQHDKPWRATVAGFEGESRW